MERGDYGPAAALLFAAIATSSCLTGRGVGIGLVTGQLPRLTRRCWDEWQRRDWASMAPRMAPDVVMGDVAEGRSHRGPAEVRARLERFVESFPDGRIEVLSIDESATSGRWRACSTDAVPMWFATIQRAPARNVANGIQSDSSTNRRQAARYRAAIDDAVDTSPSVGPAFICGQGGLGRTMHRTGPRWRPPR